MGIKIGDRVREAKGQRLVGTVVRAWQDTYGRVYDVSFEVGGRPCGGQYYGRDLEAAE